MIKNKKEVRWFLLLLFSSWKKEHVGLFPVSFARNAELLAALCAARGQHLATVLGGHSFTETVLVLSLSVVGFKCSFHRYICFLFVFFLIRGAKLGTFFKFSK